MRTSFVVGAIALSFSLGALAQQPPEMCNLTKATIFHDNHIGNVRLVEWGSLLVE